MNKNQNRPTNKKAFINGKIYTVNEKQPLAEAVVTIGNKIAFTGTYNNAKNFIDNDTAIIDLHGKLMLPGFIDNHVHFVKGGFYLTGVNLRNAKSTREFKYILKIYVSKNRGKWIKGGGWDNESWEIKQLPVKEWVDEFSFDTPILVTRYDIHVALANSYALKLAGISKNTPNPEGGIIEKNPATGEPTGILKDAAVDLVNRIIPEPSLEEYKEAVLTALEEAKRNGITSVHDITYPEDLQIYQMLVKENKLTCRIYTRLPIPDYQNLVNLKIQNGFGSDKIKIGSLKAFADGSLGASTALFFDPYSNDNSNYGLAMDYVTNGKLSEWAHLADKGKLQLSIHAIGDKANKIILDLFEDIEKKNSKWDRRFRIEHAQHLRKTDLERFAELNVIASVQPYHLVDDGSWAENKIGAERLKYTYPFKSLIDAGVKVCFGSDWYVAPLNAIIGIHAAVTRQITDGKDKNGWIPEQKISVEDAVKCYTINSAYAAFEENIKGSIELGKLADMVVLSQDIFNIQPDEIKDTKVEMTVFDGKIIYKYK